MKWFSLVLIIAALILSSCGKMANANPAPPTTASTILPTNPVATTSPPTAPVTFTPSPLPTLTTTIPPTPMAQPPYPELIIRRELPTLAPSGSVGLHNLIVFRSTAGMPFAFPPEHSGGLTRFGSPGFGYLWAISPEGQSAGRISPDGYDFDLYLSPDGKPQFIENGFTLNQLSIQPVTLPDVCNQAPAGETLVNCDQVHFSPDGRYLGFRYGQDSCGRSLRLIDRRTGETILDLKGRVHTYSFLSNGKVSINAGHCEGSYTTFFDPFTRQTQKGGGVGVQVWNLAHSIFVEAESDYSGSSSNVWGYRMAISKVFYPIPTVEGRMRYDDHVIFMPDDKRFIFQHLNYGIDSANTQATFDTPVQIVRYDPYKEQPTILASDPAYNFRLCQFDGASNCPLQWFGDWIQVQRLPFVEQKAPSAWLGGGIDVVQQCLIFGVQCPVQPDLMALNAYTGELQPWNPTVLPLAYPTPTPTPGPTGVPVYKDPNGLFALYIGADGKSLWMAPKDGPAVLWVTDGEGFVYLP
jgi:hypothetical protein